MHNEGPGLKVLSSSTYYGRTGYCDQCGYSKVLVPRLVRYWDCDDGWLTGVLCVNCGEEYAQRGPGPDDYAVVTSSDASLRQLAGVIDAVSRKVGEDPRVHRGGHPLLGQ